ncbi:MAG: plasmid partitioning protein RepB [Rhizobium sp.]|nr:plasmid partitioning protein RepB [Rhizobium sp.]
MTGRDRKNSLKALFGDSMTPAPETKSGLTAVNSPAEAPENAPPAPTPPRAASGAVKAMGLSLSSITREAEEARALRQALEEGERVVSLDTALISSSFVSDRLSEEERDDETFLALVESIRDSGQHAPILVRPHPDRPEHFQVAYGHRRLRAARRLGQPVKALVRSLSDDELVLAQGKENAERRNLSFIERALFAKALSDRGFDRKIVGEALAVQKSELSRLLQVAEAVPERFIRAIGPAPKAGRERWMALGQQFANGAALIKAEDETGSERFTTATSDDRFRLLFDRLSRRQPPPKPEVEDLEGEDGKVFARISRSGKGVRIEFHAGIDQGFAEAVAARLREDYSRFLSGTVDSH